MSFLPPRWGWAWSFSAHRSDSRDGSVPTLLPATVSSGSSLSPQSRCVRPVLRRGRHYSHLGRGPRDGPSSFFTGRSPHLPPTHLSDLKAGVDCRCSGTGRCWWFQYTLFRSILSFAFVLECGMFLLIEFYLVPEVIFYILILRKLYLDFKRHSYIEFTRVVCVCI